jgi:hypothetical protein
MNLFLSTEGVDVEEATELEKEEQVFKEKLLGGRFSYIWETISKTKSSVAQ